MLRLERVPSLLSWSRGVSQLVIVLGDVVLNCRYPLSGGVCIELRGVGSDSSLVTEFDRGDKGRRHSRQPSQTGKKDRTRKES